MNRTLLATAVAVVASTVSATFAQTQGPSTASTPYVLPVLGSNGMHSVYPTLETRSILTVDNTGATPDDTVPKVGGGTYQLNGIPDGLGAFDNGDHTFTLLVNQELGNTVGVTRAHGAKGAYVSKFVINKDTLAVVSGEDLMKTVYNWDKTNQAVGSPFTFAFNRFCSADLPAVSAYYNPTSGLGTSERIFMHGEEGGSTGYQLGTVVTGSNAGKAYVLGKFNLSTNNNSDSLTGVGAWENALANPFQQDKTVVVANNDGGTGIMSNSVSVYVGTKTNTGTEVDKAGLTNGTLKFINVAGNSAEIVNGTTRATNITNGTRFGLSSTASTTFSRPEDGAWNPLDAKQYYFVTTDRLDTVSDNAGTQKGQTRLWRLTFDDITNPDLGGTVDLLIDGKVDSLTGKKVNMFDNITVAADGTIFLQEDVGGADHNGKVWQYDPTSDKLTMLLQHDVARFGDLNNGVVTGATAPFNNDEETSGIIDITSLMADSALNTGIVGERWLLSSDQAHYTNATTGSTITSEQVEGGQIFAVHAVPEPGSIALIALGGSVLLTKRRRAAK